MSYSARRRPGLRGRIGYRRAHVVDDANGTAMTVRSPALAEFLARHLNGEPVQVAEGVRSHTTRYTVRDIQQQGGWCVFCEISSARAPSKFGDGAIACTPDRQLAEKVSRLLNDMDPELRPPVMRGSGWW